MNTQETNKLQAELNELNTAPTTSEEKKDAVVFVTGFDLFGGVLS